MVEVVVLEEAVQEAVPMRGWVQQDVDAPAAVEGEG